MNQFASASATSLPGNIGSSRTAAEIKAGTRQPQVHEQADIISQRISDMRELVLTLEERLESALRPAAPISVAESTGEKIPEPLRAPLAARMGETNCSLASLSERLRDILGRLEV